MTDRGNPFTDEARRDKVEPLPMSQDDDRLLMEVVETYIDADGLYQFVTRPGLAEALRREFADAVETLRQEYVELEAEEEEDVDGLEV